MKRRISRRDLFRYGIVGLGSVALGGGSIYSLLSPESPIARASDKDRDRRRRRDREEDRDKDDDRGTPRFTPFTADLPIPPPPKEISEAEFGEIRCDVLDLPGLKPPKFYEVRIKKNPNHEIIPGMKTEIWGYDGLYPGPTFKVKHNEPAIVRFHNDLDVETIVHNHGGHTSSESDGSASVVPGQLIPPGQSRDFCYPNIAPVINPLTGEQDTNDFACTQWYHDHAPDITGESVYRGLAGFYLLKDEVEQGLLDNYVLPNEKFDVPLVIQDRRIAGNGSLIYRPEEDDFDGWLGDVQVANGKAQPKFHVEPRKYRFRILNGANARWYTFRLTTGDFLQVANDSWLLPEAVRRQTVRLAPAERADVIIDFAGLAGSEVFIENILRQDDGRGPDELDDVVEGAGTRIVKFIVDQPLGPEPEATVEAGNPLRDHTRIDVSEIKKTRRFVFEREDGRWAINERFFDPNRDDARPIQGRAERWILENDGGGWAHPIHIHLEAHQIQSINGRPPAFHDSFKKDTVELGPDDEAEIFIKFRTFRGRYVFHCHNLEHEDMAMMAVFNVI